MAGRKMTLQKALEIPKRYRIDETRISVLYQIGLQRQLMKLRWFGEAAMQKLDERFSNQAKPDMSWCYKLILQALVGGSNIHDLLQPYPRTAERVLDLIKTPVDHETNFNSLMRILENDFTDLSRKTILHYYRDNMTLRQIAKQLDVYEKGVIQARDTTIKFLGHPFRHKHELELLLFGRKIQ